MVVLTWEYPGMGRRGPNVYGTYRVRILYVWMTRLLTGRFWADSGPGPSASAAGYFLYTKHVPLGRPSLVGVRASLPVSVLYGFAYWPSVCSTYIDRFAEYVFVLVY
jgi:hypothetical protein